MFTLTNVLYRFVQPVNDRKRAKLGSHPGRVAGSDDRHWKEFRWVLMYSAWQVTIENLVKSECGNFMLKTKFQVCFVVESHWIKAPKRTITSPMLFVADCEIKCRQRALTPVQKSRARPMVLHQKHPFPFDS